MIPAPVVVDVARPLRVIGPPEAPFRGRLVPGGAGSYCVDARDAPIEVWLARPGGHVLAAVDVDTAADGSIVLILPRLRHRITEQRASEAETPGQVVTLAVSMLRGGVHAQELGVSEGEWWVAEDGRPVLVPGGATPWQVAASDILEAASSVPATASAVRHVIDALREPVGFVRAAPGLEDELFAAAASAPLPLADGSRARGAGGGPRAAASRSERGEPVADEVTGAIERLVDADIARATRQALSSVQTTIGAAAGAVTQLVARHPSSRARPPRAHRRSRARSRAHTRPKRGRTTAPPRRRLWLVAGAAVVATLAIGLLWPHASSDPDATRSTTAASSSPPTPRAPGAIREHGEPSAAVTEEDDAARAAASVERLATCLQRSDASCRGDVLERPDADIPPGVATAPAAREVTLLDDLGDVVVVRVEDPARERPAQIVVLVARDDERLVRDVYDVADQP